MHTLPHQPLTELFQWDVGVVGRNQRSRLDKLWKDGWMNVGGKSCTGLSTATGMVTE